MTLAVPISPSAERRLAAKAKAAGVDLSTFVAQLLEAEAQRQSVIELSGQVFENFKKMRMTDEELGEQLEAEKHAARVAGRGTPFAE